MTAPTGNGVADTRGGGSRAISVEGALRPCEQRAIASLQRLGEDDYEMAPLRFLDFACAMVKEDAWCCLSAQAQEVIRETAREHQHRVSLLHLALFRAMPAKTAVVAMLLDAGIHPDSRVRIQSPTPLSMAARTHQIDVMEVLLAHGANPLLGAPNTFAVLGAMSERLVGPVKRQGLELLSRWAREGLGAEPTSQRQASR